MNGRFFFRFSKMLLGYNTNGFAHHDPESALEILAELGYGAVGITLDHGWLNPLSVDWLNELRRWKKLLAKHKFRSVIETGARFLLNPRIKHEPTLMSEDAGERAIRVQFYQRAIDTAAELGSDSVSIWSGIAKPKAKTDELWTRLCDGLSPVLEHAAKRKVVIAFEPEPGMFVATLEDYREFKKRLNHPNLKLTIDVGHLHCEGEVPIAKKIEEFASDLVNVHIEDMNVGVHEHLMFGEGEIDFPPVLAALEKIGYKNGVYVELSRHSHAAVNAAKKSIEFLRAALAKK